jgi:hypothetical protein
MQPGDTNTHKHSHNQEVNSAAAGPEPPKLKPQELKVLAEDLEAGGGIATVELKALLDSKISENPDSRLPVYGIPGSKRRRQISNKVDKWKGTQKSDPEKYLTILAGLRVVPFENRRRTRRTNRASAATNRRPVLVPSPVPSAATSPDNIAAGLANLNITRSSSNATMSTATSKPQILAIFFFKLCRANICLLFDIDTNTIKIDFTHAYQAEDLCALKAFGIRVGFNMYEGCILDIRADPRDAKYFKITFVEGTNKAVLQKPMLAAPYHLDLDDFTFTEEWMTTAQQAARTAWLRKVMNDPEARFKKITLIFPDGYKLSQRVLPENAGSQPSEDGRCTAKFNCISYRKATGHKDGNNNDVFQPHLRIVWRFVNTASCTALGLPDDNGVHAADQDVGAAFAGMP